MHSVFRADGGQQIGYGHLIRSAALADELLTRGQSVTVATATPEPAQDVFPDGVELVDLPDRGDPEPFVTWLDTTQADLVFTDSYPVDTNYQRAVRDRLPVAVLQDDSRHAVAADLFVNGNLYAAALDYEFVGRPPKTCLGTDYVLLREEIRDCAEREPPWRETPERAVVTMGGGDLTNQTPIIVEAFNGLDLYVDAIVGPGFTDTQQQAIEAAAEEVSVEVEVVRDPDDLPERLFQADFAVSTASSTTYELLALGTPIISVPVVDNQQLIAEALEERDAATVLKRGVGRDGFRAAIETYRSDSTLRRKRQRLGRSLVDAQGSKRLADQLVRL